MGGRIREYNHLGAKSMAKFATGRFLVGVLTSALFDQLAFFRRPKSSILIIGLVLVSITNRTRKKPNELISSEGLRTAPSGSEI